MAVLALANIGHDAARYADAADQKRGQADDQKEAREHVVKADQLSGDFARRFDLPGIVGEMVLDLRLDGGEIVRRQEDFVGVVGQKAWKRCSEVGHRRIGVGRDQNRQSELEAAHGIVG